MPSCCRVLSPTPRALQGGIFTIRTRFGITGNYPAVVLRIGRRKKGHFHGSYALNPIRSPSLANADMKFKSGSRLGGHC